jgi:hypothetical protein
MPNDADDKSKIQIKDLPDLFRKTYGKHLDPVFVNNIAYCLSLVTPECLQEIDLITTRVEANAITAYCFRNTILEKYHDEGTPLGKPEMKELMISMSSTLSEWLKMKNLLYTSGTISLYNVIIRAYEAAYTSNWEK